MSQFNLSEWALKRRTLVLYFLAAILFAGFYAYTRLPQKEDPDFTFKVMTIKVTWPGATAQEMAQQITDKIERKLQETPWLDSVDSYSRPGEAVIFVALKDSMPPSELDHAWRAVRKELKDIRPLLPKTMEGPFIDDQFGETYGLIYAFTSKTLDNAALAKQASVVRQELLGIPHIGRISLVGVQSEKIYIDFSNEKLAQIGIDPLALAQRLRDRNRMAPAGKIVTDFNTVRLRVSGDFDSLQSIQDIEIHARNKAYRLGDISHIYLGYADPPTFKMRFDGQDAIGLAVSMTKDADIIETGNEVDKALAANLPQGVEIHRVADQPEVVQKSVGQFVRSLLEALAIVLAVGFVSLKARAGLVVALSIPIVLAATFLFMGIFGIDLQRVSLGALIIALGLLVDDAMIAVEMMKVKIEEGWGKARAATFAYKSTAFPMLTGTLVTAAAFLPVGLAKSSAGEYTFSLCIVVTIALVASWLVAVIFTPYLGTLLLEESRIHKPQEDFYTKGFYVAFRHFIEICLERRRIVVAMTLAAFLLSLAGFSKVEQEFFPPSERPELLVDIWLPEGMTFDATERVVKGVENRLKNDKEVAHFASYVGGNTPRFYLPLDLGLPSPNYAQIVVSTKSVAMRERVLQTLRKQLDSDYPQYGIRVTRLENGPPVGFPLQYRVLGENIYKLRQIAGKIATMLKDSGRTKNVSFDSGEDVKTYDIQVDQAKARQFGISSSDLSNQLRILSSGITVSSYREGEKSMAIVMRADKAERSDIDFPNRMKIYAGSGKYVPLSDIATVNDDVEEGIVWHRYGLPVVTVRGDVPDGIDAQAVNAAISGKIAKIKLPPGYRIEIGGVAEDNGKATQSVVAVLPVTIALIVTLLMLQLRKFQLVIIVLLTAPLGIIGVTSALLLFHVPFGFVSMLGTISLAGMIMRNSVILVDQIEQDLEEGLSPWDAVVESTVRRARPILLTASAAMLAMIPLAQNGFWSPMAVVIMGGLLSATLLTLIFLPALYCCWFRVKHPS
jgi:multidrug efflux pump